jgi:hypothetical protein
MYAPDISPNYYANSQVLRSIEQFLSDTSARSLGEINRIREFP